MCFYIYITCFVLLEQHYLLVQMHLTNLNMQMVFANLSFKFSDKVLNLITCILKALIRPYSTSVAFFDDQSTLLNNTKLDPFSKLSNTSCSDTSKYLFVSFKANALLPSFGVSHFTFVWLSCFSIFFKLEFFFHSFE